VQPGLNPMNKIDAGGCDDNEHDGIEHRYLDFSCEQSGLLLQIIVT
jgi:hypothetical protein